MNTKTKKYLLNELEDIKGLKNLSAIPLLIFLVCVVIFFILKFFGIDSWFLPFYQISFFLGIFGFFMSLVKSHVKCPNCEKMFNRREKSREIAGMNFSTWVFNVFTRKCMNCGIMLNGRNVNEYVNDL